MVRIGITGGIGAGKSAAARLLAELGIPTVDTDDLARVAVERGSVGLAEVVSAFGSQVLLPDGELDRAGLARRIFSAEGERLRLEAILHPRIHQLWKRWLDQRIKDGAAVAAVVVPLLFEKGYSADFDWVVAIGCTSRTQLTRLRHRGWSDSEVEARLVAQWPMEAKMAAADRVVWNEGREEVHRSQWRRILACPKARATCCQA